MSTTAQALPASRGSSDRPPLLGQPNGNGYPPEKSRTQRIKKHFVKDVTKDYADLILLWCYIITGLLDSSAVAVWGCFASMQTGSFYFSIFNFTLFQH